MKPLSISLPYLTFIYIISLILRNMLTLSYLKNKDKYALHEVASMSR